MRPPEHVLLHCKWWIWIIYFLDFCRPLLHPSEYFFPPGILWPVGVATSLSSQGCMPGTCWLPSWPRREAKASFQRKRKPAGEGKKARLRSCSSGWSQCPARPNLASSTEHSQLPVQGRLPWYFACWCSGTEKKAEELVSLRVEDWGTGLKTGGELDFLPQFQLEFASAADGCYREKSFCPQGFLPL